MAFASVDDTEIYYEIAGQGPPLVLVSGLAGVASYWEPNIAALCDHYTVLRYDHRGTGQSARPEQAYSIELLANDLLGLMNATGFAKASLIGHSTGGAIGQVLAARSPERIDRLVLYATWASLCPQMRLCMDVRRKLLKAEGAAAFHGASPIFLYPADYVCGSWSRIDGELAVAIANSTTPTILDARIKAVIDFDGSPYLGGIAAPTLVLVADDDVLTPRFAADELVAGIVGARLQTLPYGAHAVSYCHPKAFNEAVIAFLQS